VSGKLAPSDRRCIAHASSEETLHPGEFLGSGTVGSVCGLEHDRWSDAIELEVSELGTLRNRVVAPARQLLGWGFESSRAHQ
jgi:2-keto-4-pentenoate hydratase/2-oxohepta-3-ene-1,7-dioic acid hydratase in catechol pathway